MTVSDLNNAYWTLHATIAEIIAELRKANPGATKRVSGPLGGVPLFGSFKGSGFLRLRNSKFISWATASALARRSRGYIGIMENEMETTIRGLGLGFRV